MTFKTTFKLDAFIKSCNSLRISVCDDGEAALDKWIELAEKHTVGDEITFTKQIVRNMDRYASSIADANVDYIYGDEDEFPLDLQLCLWALNPHYHVGTVLQIGDKIDTLRWVGEHYAERFDAEFEDAIKGIPHRRRLRYQEAFPTSPMTLKHIRTLDQVIANHNFDPSAMDCIERLYGEIDLYGHDRKDNKVITLIYQQLDALLDNRISFITLINTDSGRNALTTIFKSPKAFTQYWERVTAYGFKTENRNGVKTVTSYSNWYIDMSIKVCGFLDMINAMWDIYLPTNHAGTCIMSKHCEVSGQLALENKVYFTNLPLSAIQSMYPDFKVTTFQDVINGKPVNEPIVITYPERRTMAHVLLNDKYEQINIPKVVNHTVIYVGWPDTYTRGQLNIVEYDGMIEVVERETSFRHRFGTLHGKSEVVLSDLYRDSRDKTYGLDHIVREGLGTSENNMTHTLGRGFTTPRVFEDYNPIDMRMVPSMRQHGKSVTMSNLLDRWTNYIKEPLSDFDGDELTFTINKPYFTLSPAPVQYPVARCSSIREAEDNVRYKLHMGKPVTMGRYYADGIDSLPELSRMDHVNSVTKHMADVMNEMLSRRHDGYSEPSTVGSVSELPGNPHPTTPFNQHGTLSRLQMQAGDVDITEAYPKTYVEVHLTNEEDKE